ncbi:MAG: hypothetical protein HY221_02695 [Candidatus Sungbacteria bacterium]|uniref:PKD domain-containing protein n=1 Tax=Candidatus Sungiibacteriota bacterium TaxID=2750080 RepID=A0A932R1Z9_9BACT|nr:hypothetical protein [Candidatus Sungbacteria bacterium]
MKRIRCKTFVLGMLLFAAAAHAQVAPPPLSLSASPSSPGPGEQIFIQAATPSFEKDSVFFDWTVEGRARPDLSGLGKNTITLTAGNLGSTISVSVDITRSSSGETGKASLRITVADLSLLWTAETIIPPWYRGKALATPGSVVDIIASPEFVIDGAQVAPENLIYHWTMDDQTDALVGVGKQIFPIKTSDIPQTSHQIQVVVEDPDQRIRKQGQIFILSGSPHITIYPYTPLGGVEPRTNTSFAPPSRKGGLLDVIAEAFFFPVATKHDLSFSWTVFGAPVAGAVADPGLLTIDPSTLPQAQGPVSISVSAQYTKSLIPLSASQQLNLSLP